MTDHSSHNFRQHRAEVTSLLFYQGFLQLYVKKRNRSNKIVPLWWDEKGEGLKGGIAELKKKELQKNIRKMEVRFPKSGNKCKKFTK